MKEVERYITNPHLDLEDCNAMQTAFFIHVGANSFRDKSYLRFPADPSVWCAERVLPSTHTDPIEVRMSRWTGPSVENGAQGRVAEADGKPPEPNSAMTPSQDTGNDGLGRVMMTVMPPPAQLVFNAVQGVAMQVLRPCIVRKSV